MSKYKISIIIPSLRGGGAERSMLTLANSLAEKDYDVNLVLIKKEGPYVSDVAMKVKLINFDKPRVLKSFFPLRKYIIEHQPDILISALTHLNIISVIAQKLSNTKTINIVGERNSLYFSNSLFATIKKKMIQWSYNQARIVTAVSEDVRFQIIKHLNLAPSSVQTIYNPVVSNDLIIKSRVCPEHIWLKDKSIPVILGAGRLTKQKGFETLIRAFYKVRNSKDCKLIIIGDGEERKRLEILIKKLGLENSVSLPGFVSNPFSFMRKSDLFVLSSKWEGLPGVLIQAMACGTPVISTDCPGGSREILKNGKFGALVPVDDIDRLSKTMIKYLNNLSEVPSGIERAHDFSVEKSVDQYEKLFESVLS